MNINEMRNAVIDGQISTLQGQIFVWEVYADRTGEDVTPITDKLFDTIGSLEVLKTQ